MELEEKEPDIKQFITHILSQINIFQNSLCENKESYKVLNLNLGRVEKTTEDINIDVANSILDTLESIEKNFRKLVTDEKIELGSLKEQISTLNQDNMKIEQSCVLLGTRTGEIEKTIGVDLRLPSIEVKRK